MTAHLSICPSCGRYDNLYLRSGGGALVCRACFVTETLLGSWLALEGPAPVAPGHDNCEEKR